MSLMTDQSEVYKKSQCISDGGARRYWVTGIGHCWIKAVRYLLGRCRSIGVSEQRLIILEEYTNSQTLHIPWEYGCFIRHVTSLYVVRLPRLSLQRDIHSSRLELRLSRKSREAPQVYGRIHTCHSILQTLPLGPRSVKSIGLCSILLDSLSHFISHKATALA
jgi:hypothetical protein